jgi:hypothetical protein
MYSDLQRKLVLIRLPEGGMNFIYTVIGDDGVEDAGEVDPEVEVADGYWGGSEAVD